MYFSTFIVGDLIEYGSMKGINVAGLQRLHDELTDQDYIGYDAVVEVINLLNKELQDEYLGLHIGEQISLKVTSQVNNIMLNSKTLEESIRNAIDYSRLISDALQCSLRRSENHYAIVYDENPNWKVKNSFAKKTIIDLALLSNVKSLDAYTNRSYFPAYINFTHEKPTKLHEYYRLFNCSLKFNQPVTEIVYDRHIIDRHTKNIEHGLLENLQEKVAVEIANLVPEEPLINDLKKCILYHKPHRITIEEAADELHLSKRTLQRKLKELDTTFKKIEYELQLALSQTYLAEKHKSIDEISYLLGFSESSAFIRFFKSLTSFTPMQYQNKLS